MVDCDRLKQDDRLKQYDGLKQWDRLKQCEGKVYRPLQQLMGMWEVHGETMNDITIDNDTSATAVSRLGVCKRHFNYDQNQLHKHGTKHLVSAKQSWVYKHQCLFCNHNKFFFNCDGVVNTILGT